MACGRPSEFVVTFSRSYSQITGGIQPMKARTLLYAFFTSLFCSGLLLADHHVIDCGKNQSLNTAIQFASPGETITFTGTCHENVTITTSALTVAGVGSATISPSKSSADAVAVIGAQRVTLSGFTVQNGLYGIHAKGNAGVTLNGVTVEKSNQSGILIEGDSSAYISNSSTSGNGFNGIDAENSSSLTFTGTFTTSGNAVFGMDLGNSSSATLNSAIFTATGNTLGIQVSLSSSLFLADPGCALNANNNFTTGLTIVSGAHMVDFGGTIVTNNNGINGISLFSRSGLDLDAASLVTSASNLQDGVHLEELSTLNLFNTPAFSGVPGVTTLDVHGNSQNGISALLNSQVHMFNQTTITGQNNSGFGIQVDNGSSLTLLTSTIQSNHSDVNLTFGSRGEFTGNTIGTLFCDKTSLIRGDTGKSCPTP